MIRKLNKVVRNFFGLSRSQANAFIILLPVMAIILFSEPAYHWWIASREHDYHPNAALLDSIVGRWEMEQSASDPSPDQRVAATFDFNPNYVSIDELQTLGFSPSLAKRMVNYRNKGGKFRIKSDVLKIYGMDTLLYHRLYTHILLPNSVSPVTPQETKFSKSKPEIVQFDINTADSVQLKEIKGIGSKLSLRIINYRNKLGGFVSMRQLEEVWGLDTAVVKQLNSRSFVAENYIPSQIGINQATENELAAHPYLSRTAAKTLVAYRFQHGPFASIEDLAKIQALDINTIQKITPYLRFQN